MARRKPSGRIRTLGQVFTPRLVADWMARWILAPRPRRVLDPALGEGVFIDAVRDIAARRRGDDGLVEIDALDIDVELLRTFAAREDEAGSPVRVRAREADFLSVRLSQCYDAAIANPPYIRHHEGKRDDAVFARFDRICGRRLSRMTNTYGLFLIKIWTLLAERGRAAIITPAEWLNADFGSAIKAYLLEENAIDAIVHFDHASKIFAGAMTTAAITLLRRDRRPNDPIRFCRAADSDALLRLKPSDGVPMRREDLNADAKWTPLFTRSKASASRDKRANTTRAAKRHTLGEIARCSRGIATGANDYFTLRESDRIEHGIDLRDLSLCITKAHHIGTNRLTQADVRRLVEADQRIYLLNPRRALTKEVKRYLDIGRRAGIDRRYLPAHRPEWFRPEHREPAPILISVFARGAFKVVLNAANALNLTAYHGIYLHEPTRERIRALHAYVVSAAGRKALLPHHRIYAEGLLKVEPRDVEAVAIPDALYRACGGA